MYVGVTGLGTKLGLSKKWRRNLQSLSISKQLGWESKKKQKAGAAKVQKVQDESAARQEAADVELQKQLAMIRSLTPELLTPANPLVTSAPKTPPAMAKPAPNYTPWIAGGAALLLLAFMLPKGGRR